MTVMTLADIRKQRGLSQRKLSEASGVYKSTIIAIEACKSRTENISLRKAKGLADALGITMEQLLDLDN